MRRFESVDVLVLPDSELLPQTLVPHLQSCNLEVLPTIGPESSRNVFPWKTLIFLELYEVSIILAEICRCNRRSPLPFASRGASFFVVVSPSFLRGHASWVGSNVRIRSPRLWVPDLRWT